MDWTKIKVIFLFYNSIDIKKLKNSFLGREGALRDSGLCGRQLLDSTFSHPLWREPVAMFVGPSAEVDGRPRSDRRRQSSCRVGSVLRVRQELRWRRCTGNWFLTSKKWNEFKHYLEFRILWPILIFFYFGANNFWNWIVFPAHSSDDQ